MATQRAWWSLVISEEMNGPHDDTIELSDVDKEHIAELIAADYTSGIVEPDPPSDHELVWESAGTDDPGDQHADSERRVEPEATSAYYSLGPGELAPGENGERWWTLELVQLQHGEVVGELDLGHHHPDERSAKDYAETYERYGTAPPRR